MHTWVFDTCVPCCWAAVPTYVTFSSSLMILSYREPFSFGGRLPYICNNKSNKCGRLASLFVLWNLASSHKHRQSLFARIYLAYQIYFNYFPHTCILLWWQNFMTRHMTNLPFWYSITPISCTTNGSSGAMACACKKNFSASLVVDVNPYSNPMYRNGKWHLQ